MRTLIIRPAALGDTLMLAPALSDSHEWAEVIVAGRRPGIDFLSPLVSSCLDFEGQGWHSLFMDVPDSDLTLPVREADKVMAFLNDPQGGVRKNLERFFPGASIAVLPGYPGKDEPVHVALYLARALENHGFPIDAEKVMKESVKRPLLLFSQRPRLRIVFHPGSGGEQKNHPPEFWLNLIRAFQEKMSPTQERPVFLLGPAEENLFPLFSEVENLRILLSPDKDELLLLLQEALLYVGHDSGISHLAAMMGASTIALFRHASVKQWRPLGPKVKVIESDTSGPGLIEETLRAGGEFIALP
jgi:ADP-heptose:LPS heptosyltransferase